MQAALQVVKRVGCSQVFHAWRVKKCLSLTRLEKPNWKLARMKHMLFADRNHVELQAEVTTFHMENLPLQQVSRMPTKKGFRRLCG